MKKINVFTIVFMLLISFFCSCSKNTNIKNEELTTEINSIADIELGEDLFPIKTYADLEIPYPNHIQSDFDKKMISNPIDSKMKSQLYDIMSSGTREQQVFFDNYLKLWTNELEQALSNLESYLSESELNQLQQSQQQWENAILSNDEFEKSVITNNNINLGTQVVASRLITKIEKYRERTFYIKYLTMLIEQYRIDPISEEKQLWCSWASVG